VTFKQILSRLVIQALVLMACFDARVKHPELVEFSGAALKTVVHSY
jgi:hypothetical protein